ncbi:MAG: hypothetical protein K1X66_02325 [Verrucomicrobiae bacterium]|nr:hypothetical protein [Verrucomicrobiae bacterium]
MADLFQPQYGFSDSIAAGYVNNKARAKALEENSRQFDLSHLIDRARTGIEDRRVGLGEQEFSDRMNQRGETKNYLSEIGKPIQSNSDIGMADILQNKNREGEFDRTLKLNDRNFQQQKELEAGRAGGARDDSDRYRALGDALNRGTLGLSPDEEQEVVSRMVKGDLNSVYEYLQGKALGKKAQGYMNQIAAREAMAAGSAPRPTSEAVNALKQQFPDAIVQPGGGGAYMVQDVKTGARSYVDSRGNAISDPGLMGFGILPKAVGEAKREFKDISNVVGKLGQFFMGKPQPNTEPAQPQNTPLSNEQVLARLGESLSPQQLNEFMSFYQNQANGDQAAAQKLMVNDLINLMRRQ